MDELAAIKSQAAEYGEAQYGGAISLRKFSRRSKRRTGRAGKVFRRSDYVNLRAKRQHWE